MAINVVNTYKHEATPADVYIGRGSPLENKWAHLDSKHPNTIKVADRQLACHLHAVWFNKNWDKDPLIISELARIVRLEQEYGCVNLVCFCKPQACHGDTIAAFLEERKQEHLNGLST